MKILLSGHHNPHFISITEYLEEAVGELGHELVSFENRRFLLPGRIRRRVALLHRLDLRRLNRALLRLARSTRPDLFLETGGHRILPAAVERLRAMGIRTGLWTIDPPTDFEPVARAAPHYDTIVCGGTEAMEILASRGIDLAHWLPFACAPRHHRPLELSAEARNRFGSEVAFVGSHYPNRARILERLADLDLGIWGPGWHRLPDAHPLRARIRGEHVGPEDWVRIYAASEIVVIVHYQDGTTPCHQASPKVYETLACGALALVDDQRDVFDLFRDGEHLVRFSDEDDLVVKVRRYLSAPGERRRIAEAGRREVLARHTYRHRVEHLTALVRGDAFPRSCPSRAADP